MAWSRGRIQRLSLPLQIDATHEWLAACARGGSVQPGAPLRCELSSVAIDVSTGRAVTSEDGVVSPHEEAEEEDEEDEMEDEDDEGDDDAEVNETAAPRRSFELRLDPSSPFASAELAGEGFFHPGGAIRGRLTLADGWWRHGGAAGEALRGGREREVVRVRVALLLQEWEPGAEAPLESRTVAKADLCRSPPTASAAFALPVPSHLPPESAAIGHGVGIRWALQVTFEFSDEAGGGVATAAASAASASRAPIPWLVPLRVVPAPETVETRAIARDRAQRTRAHLAQLAASAALPEAERRQTGGAPLSWRLATMAQEPAVAHGEMRVGVS